jgi:type I restriction enzyme S subunit
LPSLNEQIRITVALDDELRNLTNTIQRIEGEISLIREYRTRLIADVVTGKLDVRTVAAQLPDEIDEPDVVEEIDEMTESDDDLAELSEEMSEE